MKENLAFLDKIKGSIFLRDAGTAFILKILGAATALGLQLFLVRLLSVNDYGQYTYILAWANIIAAVSSLGFSTSIIRFIPEFLRKQEFAKIRGVINTSIYITLSTGFILACIIVPIMYFTESIEGSSFFFIGIIIPVLALFQLFARIEKGKKRMFFAHAPIEVFKNILMAGGLAIFLLFNLKIDLNLTLIIFFTTTIILIIWHFFELKRGLPSGIFKSKSKYEIQNWIKISLPFLLINGFMLILNRTDIIMLGIFSSPEEVAIYNVAFKIATLTTFILTAVSAIAAPTISDLYFQDKFVELRNFAKKTAHLVFWPTLLMTIGIVLFSDFILLLFGPEYLPGKFLLFILLIGQLINASVGAVGYYLNMTGYQKDSAKVFAYAALINLVLNPIAIYYYGAIGAAWVTMFTMAFWNIWLFWLVKKKLAINSSIF